MSERSSSKERRSHHEHKRRDSSDHRSKHDKGESKGESEEKTPIVIPKFQFKTKLRYAPKEVSTIGTEPISISEEFDNKYVNGTKSQVDRSYWETEVFRLHPDLKDLVYRLDPVCRAAALSGLFLPTRRLYSHEGILSLILQHLTTLGLHQTAEELVGSFSVDLNSPYLSTSQLVYHLERGILNSESFWSLLLPTPTVPVPQDGKKPNQNETKDVAVKKQLTAQCANTLGIIALKSEDESAIQDEDLANLQNIQYDEATKLPDRGSMNQLVWAAASRYRSFSQSFIDIIATAYHTFMTSHQYLKKLQEAWIRLQGVWSSNPKARDSGELMFVALVEKWIEISFYDFDTMLTANLYHWITTMEFQNKAAARRLLTAYQKQISGAQSGQVVEFSAKGVRIPPNLFTGNFTLLEMDLEELARQITMYAGRFYYKITAKELLDCAWSKPRIRHRAPNIIAITNHFNCLNQYVQREIIFAPTIEARLQVMRTFAELAHKLWEMHNYFDGMAVATAFDASPIFRLKHHKKAAGEPMNYITQILEDSKNTKNWAVLRAKHDEAIVSGDGTVIPYIGIYLTQLTFFYDGNLDRVDGLVNFKKCEGIYTLVSKCLSYQKKQFRFSLIEQVQSKIAAMGLEKAPTLLARSQEIEPKGVDYAGFEKMMAEGK